MGKRKLTTVRIDEEVLKKAHDLGLNVSKVCENALKELIRRIESPIPTEKPKNSPKNQVVGLPGFEPGSREPKSRSLDQASRQPLFSFVFHFQSLL